MKDFTETYFLHDENIDESGYLWQYMSFHKFLSFLKNEKLYLARLDQFEDQMEGIRSYHLGMLNLKKQLDVLDELKGGLTKHITIENLPSQVDKIDEEISIIQRFNFANCWFYEPDGNVESVAMWNLYSSPNGVAIRIKYEDFKNRLLEFGVQLDRGAEKIILSRVIYSNFQNPASVKESERDSFDSIFVKDECFKHESEFRIIAIQKPSKIPEIQHKKGISKRTMTKLHNDRFNYLGINMFLKNFKDYPFEIIFHPKSDDWAVDDLEDLISKYTPEFKTRRSRLKLT